MRVQSPKTETIGFGFDQAGAYHFVVDIPSGAEGVVRISEHFAYGESVEDAATRVRFSAAPQDHPVRQPNPKVEISAHKWQRVADEVRAEFNRRLLGEG